MSERLNIKAVDTFLDETEGLDRNELPIFIMFVRPDVGLACYVAENWSLREDWNLLSDYIVRRSHFKGHIAMVLDLVLKNLEK